MAPAPAGPDGAPGGGGPDMFIILILMFVGMYFLIIAPQRKKQKQHEKRIAALKSGDKIVTSGGLYGTVVNVKDDRLVLKLGENIKVELAKQFVAYAVDPDKEKADTSADEKK